MYIYVIKTVLSLSKYPLWQVEICLIMKKSRQFDPQHGLQWEVTPIYKFTVFWFKFTCLQYFEKVTKIYQISCTGKINKSYPPECQCHVVHWNCVEIWWRSWVMDNQQSVSSVRPEAHFQDKWLQAILSRQDFQFQGILPCESKFICKINKQSRWFAQQWHKIINNYSCIKFFWKP